LTIPPFRYTILGGKFAQGNPMPSTKKFEMLDTDKMNPLITRQMLNGDDATFARLVLLKGAIVPRHFHRSEQYTMIFSGALKFIFDDGSETTVTPGEVLMIPANVPHSAEALEDTVDFDFFSPRREDWIRKDDAYLRAGAKKEQ
jgi:quercetin dioxygenase-like cupin family protein